VLVSFHTDDNNGFNIERQVQSHPRLGTIIACTTNKELGGASGSFSLVIKKPATMQRSALRVLWRDPENVWVRIKFMCDGQVFDTMLGLIDSVNEDTSRSGMGARSETYTISGRDFGKVLESTELFVNFFHNIDNPVRSQGALTSAEMQHGISGTPAFFVRVLLDDWVGNNGAAEQQWALPASLGGGFFANILSLGGIQSMDETTNGWAIAPSLFAVDQTGGKLWEVMQEYANPVLNEMFIDLGLSDPRRIPSAQDLSALRPVLYLRERPFPIRSDDNRTTDSTKWNQLRTHVLQAGDVHSRKIAKGGAVQRYNYWGIRLDGIGTEGFNVPEILQRGVDGVEYGRPGNIPIFNNESIQRNGVRPYSASTRFIPFITTGADNDSDVEDRMRSQATSRENIWRLCARWLKKLHDWYVIAPFELSGKLELTRLMPEIRVGHRVKERRAEGTITYYVEAVEHSFQFPSVAKTTLTVTRGEYDDDDLLDFVYETYDSPRALTEREACLIPLDADLTDTELDDFMRQGCTVSLPDRNFAQVLFESQLQAGNVTEGAGFTVDNADQTQGPSQRTLEIEQDGHFPREGLPDDFAVQDPGMNRTLNDSEDIGDRSDIPAPGERGSTNTDPVLDQTRLERGLPIDSDLDFAATDDPIAGIEDAGS
jgi:hypothetical protein